MQRIPQEDRKRTYISILVMSALLVGLVAATIWSWPYIILLIHEEGRTLLRQYIDSSGWRGVLTLLGIQILQIVVAIIPGEPIEVVSGVLYGGWGGFALCMVGIIIGQAAIFYAVKKFGRPLVRLFFKEEELNRYKFLNDEKKLQATIFLLYFIPGTPKDILVYVCALTKIDMKVFLYTSVIARIPSVLSSTIAGSQLASGNWGTSILLFLVCGIIGLAGIFYGESFLKKMQSKRKH